MMEPDNHITAVEAWFDAFDVKIDFVLQETLIVEEATELLAAIVNGFATTEDCAEVLKEAADLAFVLAGFHIMEQRRTTETFRFSEDTLRLVEGCFNILHSMQENMPILDDLLTETFFKVCASNMSKLGDDGKPIRREDGKVMKGPNYALPDLTREATWLHFAIQHLNAEMGEQVD